MKNFYSKWKLSSMYDILELSLAKKIPGVLEKIL